jgi:hypothetical protein
MFVLHRHWCQKHFFIVVVFMLAFALPLVSAQESDDVVLLYISSAPFVLEHAVVVNYIDVYGYDDFDLPESPPGAEGYEIVMEDGSGSSLFSAPLSSISYSLPYDSVSSAFKFKILHQGVVVFENPLSFCDSDGVCEQCVGENCVIAENSLTCRDCHSGALDGYCDEEPDGICDPDCRGMLDFDCGTLCKDMNGSICDEGEICLAKTFTSSIDSSYCCVGSRCMEIGEYVQTMVTMQSQPGMVIAPSGKFVSSMQDAYAGDYCVDQLKGSVCDAAIDYCDGDVVEYYYNAYCCLGDCVTYPESSFQPVEFVAELRNETSRPLSQAEMYSIYNFSAMEKQLEAGPEPSYPEENLLDLPEGDFPHDGIAKAAEEPPLLSEEFISDIGRSAADAVGKVSEKVDFVHVALIALGVSLLVVLCVFLFKRSASIKVSSESAAVDLQAEIDSLVAKGNDYKQVEQILVAKGVDRAVVDAEIKRNYDRRVQLQRVSQQVRR